MPDNYLVTGSRGGSTPHVTSSQARNFNAGIVGGDRYVMEGLGCVVTSANKVHVDPGVACFCGADVEVPPGGVDLNISNGSQGMKRNDLVVLRYESGSTEKVTLAVITGTPAASNPSDPSYNDGDIRNGDSPVDMPLYRVPLDGISVGDPEPVYETVPSIASLRDSVSQTSRNLFEGSWNGRSRQFPGLSNYELFRVFVSGMTAPVVCCGHPNSNYLIGSCAYTTDFPDTHVFTIRFDRDRDWLDLDYCYDATVHGGNVVSQSPTITGIYGVR